MIDKEALLSDTRVLPHDTVPIPDVGEVEVRGLSRAEVVQLQSCETHDEFENRLMAAGMVNPSLTLEEAQAWRSRALSPEIRPVADRIMELSGLGENQQHDKERSFRPEPGEG